MNYIEHLKSQSKKHKTILCFGIDPNLDKFPKSIKGSKKKKIIDFYCSIIDGAPKYSFCALKPNYAFFAQYGLEGIEALCELIGMYKRKYTIILDVKRGDISNTATAYAKEGYEFFDAHSLTLSPLMGKDSIFPFLQYFDNKSKGAYLLCRTSNPGANDFLTKQLGAQTLYSSILQTCIGWDKRLGFVVGATDSQDLKKILNQIPSDLNTPLLIPGVGSQGGNAQEVMSELKSHINLLYTARINASSSIAYAFKIRGNSDFVSCAHDAMADLNEFLRL